MDREWFEYLVRVRPSDTDYGRVVWHGAYVAWMEAARVEWLRSRGSSFGDWVAAGIDLPVVDLTIRYRQSLTLDDEALVLASPQPVKGIRLIWDYDIQNRRTGVSCVIAQVTLVPVDMISRKPVRRLPLALKQVLPT